MKIKVTKTKATVNFYSNINMRISHKLLKPHVKHRMLGFWALNSKQDKSKKRKHFGKPLY